LRVATGVLKRVALRYRRARFPTVPDRSRALMDENSLLSPDYLACAFFMPFYASTFSSCGQYHVGGARFHVSFILDIPVSV
jgi:hypothetical protein